MDNKEDDEIHAYKRKKDGTVIRLKSVNTIGKLKRHPTAFHSCTGACGVVPNFFIDKMWKPKRIMELARQYPDHTQAQIEEELWGWREGQYGIMNSGLFGTEAHESMEFHLQDLDNYPDFTYKDWYSWLCEEFIDYVTEHDYMVEKTEYMDIDDIEGVGMTIDFIAKTSTKKFHLFDFKFRDCNVPSSATYDKDLVQLAENSITIMRNWKLDYLPPIHSVVVDVNTSKTHVKRWKQSLQLLGIEAFSHANWLYKFTHRML